MLESMLMAALLDHPVLPIKIYGRIQKVSQSPISESDSGTSDVSTVIESERNSDTKEVNLSVTVNPQFVISSTSQREDDILQIIKMHMKELADDLGGELADRLGEVFSNMPVSS